MIGFGQCIRGDCENGFGTKVTSTGRLICNFKNGIAEGIGKYIYNNGDKFYGEFKDDDMKHGVVTIGKKKDVYYWRKDSDTQSVRFSVFQDFYKKYQYQLLDERSYLEDIEGVYRYHNMHESFFSYKFLVLKDFDKYLGFVIDGDGVKGEVWFKMIETAIHGVYDVTWKLNNNTNNPTTNFLFNAKQNGALMTNNSGLSLIKLYPKVESVDSKEIRNWTGNGSGIIISKSGYIITNHHVIDDADDIEVEFILDDEVQKFNAEIVQSDKVNDLAIIKIVDDNFDGVKELPYNFKTRSSDVGTKVYAFGYPMALTIMGKEIKVTDGIISSKTGYDGDITTYQISAPIQGGNSGGPLFDDKGNFIGINSAKLNVKIADNVGYSIKSSYLLNLIDVLPETISLPSSTQLASKPLTEQIKTLSDYVVLIKVK